MFSLVAIVVHSPTLMKMSAFQFYQSEPGKATLKVVPVPGCGKKDIVPFIQEISAKIGVSMTFDIEIVDEIAQNMRGKAKLIDQQLDLGGGNS